MRPRTLALAVAAAVALPSFAGCWNDGGDFCDSCFTGGERAQGHRCPDGETCSASTPGGLYFVGARFSDDDHLAGVRTTAVGGTQSIRLSTAAPLYARDLADPYTADVAAPLAVVDAQGSHVTVSAAATGTARLSVRDGHGDLDDRISIAAAAIDHVVLATTAGAPVPDGSQPWGVHGGGFLGLAVQLFAADGTRLVDQSMKVSGTAVDDITPLSWDTFEVVATATTPTVEVDVAAGQRPVQRFTFPLVDRIDRIAADDATLETTGRLDVGAGQTRSLCFRGRRGALEVIGTALQIDVTGDLTVQANSGGCVSGIVGAGGGDATLDVSADGVTRRFTIHSVAR